MVANVMSGLICPPDPGAVAMIKMLSSTMLLIPTYAGTDAGLLVLTMVQSIKPDSVQSAVEAMNSTKALFQI